MSSNKYMTEWKTVSSKVSAETYSAMKVLCARETPQIKINQLVRNAIEKEVAPILNKGGLTSESFPGIGENIFEYDPESDNFRWVVDTGNNSLVISNNLSPSFVENLFKVIDNSLTEKKKIMKKTKKGQVFLPKSIRRFGK